MQLAEFLLQRIAEDEADVNRGPEAMSNYGLRWDSARVLAECEAKRRIVELHFDGRSGTYSQPWCNVCSEDEYLEPLPCDTLRALTAVYADHPDYRDEWKP